MITVVTMIKPITASSLYVDCLVLRLCQRDLLS